MMHDVCSSCTCTKGVVQVVLKGECTGSSTISLVLLPPHQLGKPGVRSYNQAK